MGKDAERTHVGFLLPALYGGGVERVFLDLAKGMAQRGLRVEVVVAGDEGPLRKGVPPGVSLVSLGLSPRFRLVRAYPFLQEYLARTRPAWVLPAWGYFDPVPLRAAWHAGASTLFVLHNTPDYYDDLPPLKRRLALWGARWSLQELLKREERGQALVGGVSQGVLEEFERRFALPLKNKEVFPNPIDLGRVYALAEAPCPHPWAAEGRPFFLAVGRLHPQKAFDLLLEAFALFRRGWGEDVRLLILGEGPDRQRLEALRQALGLAGVVDLPGFATNPYPCFRRATAFLLTSFYEGFGLVLLEALALGVPVVAARSRGGAREALGNGAWGLWTERSPEALAQAMAKALHGEVPVPSAQELRDHLDRHSLENVTAHYLRRMRLERP